MRNIDRQQQGEGGQGGVVMDGNREIEAQHADEMHAPDTRSHAQAEHDGPHDIPSGVHRTVDAGNRGKRHKG